MERGPKERVPVGRNRRWKVRDFRQRLRELGCALARTSGSHEVWTTADGAPLPPFVGKDANAIVSFCVRQSIEKFLATRGMAL